MRTTQTTSPAQVEERLAEAARALDSAPEVALACHINPDPDALGSMLGLARFLEARGAHVVCSWGNEPMLRPRWLGMLGGEELLVEPPAFPEAPAVMVTLDAASIDRLGPLASRVSKAGQTIVLDHHRTNPGFGTIDVIDPNSAATAEMVFRLVERMGGDLPDAAAACLYAGLITDTGRFQYEATTPETLRIAAELRRHDFDHAALARALYEDGSLGYLRVLGWTLDRLAFEPEAGLAWTYVLQADLERAGVDMTETDDLIDAVRVAREADVTCVMKQQRDGAFKVSLRSRGGSDVAAIAQRHGGGGHRLAAGYTAPGGLQDAVADIVLALRGGGAGADA